MPQYKVIAPGFFEGEIYSPEGKRSVLRVAKPFPKKKLPSWLAEMPKESAAVKAKRESQEESQKAAVEQKAEQDQKDIDGASFLGEGESAGSTNTVENI